MDRPSSAGSLLRAVVAVTRTKRRRYLWCAWWTGTPAADPFRPPDAWKGGSRSVEDAVAEARHAAGVELSVVESRWAGAWLRVRDGLPPFRERQVRVASVAPRSVDPHATLGVPVGAPLEELKARFRESARAPR